MHLLTSIKTTHLSSFSHGWHILNSWLVGSTSAPGNHNFGNYKVGNSHHGFVKGKSHLNNLIALYAEKTSAVDCKLTG